MTSRGNYVPHHPARPHHHRAARQPARPGSPPGTGPATVPRTVRVLRVLADEARPLTAADIAQVLGEAVPPCSQALQQLAAAGQAEAAGTAPGRGRRQLWRITGAGLHRLATADAAPGHTQPAVTDSTECALQQVTQTAIQQQNRPGRDQQQLHEAVRRALAAGAPPTDIAQAAGLSRSRIYAIGQATVTADSPDDARRATQLRSMPRTQLRRLCTPPNRRRIRRTDRHRTH